MGRFHINKHGVPAPCQASEGNCPLGEGPGSHFSSLSEAEVAMERVYEEKYGVLSVIENSSTDSSDEAAMVEENLKSIVDKDKNPTAGSLGFGRNISEEYIMYSKHPDKLRDASAQDIKVLENQMKKDYLKKMELANDIIFQSSKFESIYNNKMGEIVEKDVKIVRSEKIEDYSNESRLRRVRSSISSGISLAFGRNNSGSNVEVSRDGSSEVGRKESVVESRTETLKGKMRKEEIDRNSIAAGKNMELEIKKEEMMEIHIDPTIDMIKRLDERADEKINSVLKNKVNMIRHPEMKEKALNYLEDLNEIQNKNYISDTSRKRITAKFNKANESGKAEDLVGCNRLIDMIENKDRNINDYLARDINEITFQENYQRVKDGSAFVVRSQEDVSKEIKNITDNLISCFDY